MKDKYDYMQNFNVNSKEDIAKTVAVFSAFTEGLHLFASFAIGSLTLSCLGSISSSMNLMNQRNFLLGSVIVMIFSVPIIIFSVGIINMEESFNSLINILFGILLIVFAINPWASGLCLKLSLENN